MRDAEVAGNLEAWAAAARVEAAAASRAREFWLRRVAEEGATLAGLLIDLAEAGGEVGVIAGGRPVHGRIVAVAEDFIAMRSSAGPLVLLPLTTITTVRPARGSAEPATGDRPPAADATFAGVLGGLAAERPRVQLHTANDAALAGVLVASGDDVVSLRLDGAAGVAYVATGRVVDVVLVDEP